MLPRRYVTVLQDRQGYPARGDAREDGLEYPMVVIVVKEDDYERLAKAVREALDRPMDAKSFFLLTRALGDAGT